MGFNFKQPARVDISIENQPTNQPTNQKKILHLLREAYQKKSEMSYFRIFLMLISNKSRGVRCVMVIESRKWTLLSEFKSSTKLLAFHILPLPLGMICIQVFSLQLSINSKENGFFKLGMTTNLGKGKLSNEFKPGKLRLNN